MSAAPQYPYETRLNVLFPHLQLIDEGAVSDSVTHPWFNQTLCKVNDSVVRVGVVQGEYHWHKHDNDDEFFYVVEGKLLIDLEDRIVELGPRQGFVVSKGVVHRTRAPQRTVMLRSKTRESFLPAINERAAYADAGRTKSCLIEHCAHERSAAMLRAEPTQRFSARVENYARFRPSYPGEVLDLLREQCGLTPEFVIADVASGTGLFTRLLLENGNRVFGVEPNENMREAGEEYLGSYPKFVSVAGTAEATTLPGDSVDMITSAQAAHWFEREVAMPEFQRILKPGRYLVLLWNDRRTGSAFAEKYENLVVKYGTDYSEVQRLGRAIDGGEFFAPLRCEKRTLPNYQDLDYAALEGRLLSSSYAPQIGELGCEAMLSELRTIFEEHQRGGLVRMEYDTNVYYGRIHQ